MNSNTNKKYDLEERTLSFSLNTRDFLKKIFNDPINKQYVLQLIRSSASIGANYIEANESLSTKDFYMRIKISRKEAKESLYWFKLLSVPDNSQDELKRLTQECTELMKIFGSIVTKTAQNQVQ